MPYSASNPYLFDKIGFLAISKEVTQGLPNWSFTATGGTTTTFTVDTTSGNTHDNNIASAADDFFNGAQVFVVSATNVTAGSIHTVSDFAVSGGTATFTVDTMDGAGAVSDTFYVWWPMPAFNVSMNFGYENLPRDFVRETLDMPPSLKGLKTCDGSFDVEIPGLETPAADGTAPGLDRWSALLSVIGTRSAGVGEAVTGSGSTTTQVDVTDASLFSVGDYVLINNEIRRVTTVDTAATPDNIIVSPALAAAPAASDVVYSGEVFTPDETGHQTLGILYRQDDRLTEIRGAVCSIKLAAEFGQFLVGTVEFNAAYMDTSGNLNGWDLSNPFTSSVEMSTKKPPVYKTSAAQHFGTTELKIASWEFDLGHERGDHRYVECHIFSVIARNATASVNYKDASIVPKETWEANGTEDHLLLAAGKSAGDAVLVAGNAQIQDPSANANNNEFLDWNSTFGFVDDQNDSSAPNKPKVVRF